MTIATQTINDLNNEFFGLDAFISQEIHLIKEQEQAKQKAIVNFSKSFLDKVFPLDKGSHENVVSYLVYYNHLLAFFKDGTQSGLKSPKQFVALAGHKEEPESILLKSDDRHVELVFNRTGKVGQHDRAKIDDILIETFIKPNVPSWYSMVKEGHQSRLNYQGEVEYSNEICSKSFTDKQGNEYKV